MKIISWLYVSIPKVKHFFHVLYLIWNVKQIHKNTFAKLKKSGISHKRLTREQKKQVDRLWNGMVSDYSTHELALSVTGKFDPRVCSLRLLRTKIEFAFNNQNFAIAWADKNYINKFFPNFKFPNSFLHNVDGVFYDSEYNLITKEEALALIAQRKKYVVKKAYDTMGGCNIVLADVNDNAETILSRFKKDYVVQDVLNQCEMFKKFSPVSVNVMRIITLRIGNEISVVNASFRAGTGGAATDNYIDDNGKGMFVIGINPDGTLKETGYYSCGEYTDTLFEDFKFGGMEIPNFKKAVELALKGQEQLGYFGLIGWDIVIDEKNEPVIMEYNLKKAGGIYYQWVNDCLFGEKTENVIKFLSK